MTVIAKEMQRWLKKMDIKTLYVEAGAPWQNGYIESFNSRLRDEFLEMNYFYTLAEAQQLTQAWKEKYNTQRPQRALEKMTPSEFAACCAASGVAERSEGEPVAAQQALLTQTHET